MTDKNNNLQALESPLPLFRTSNGKVDLLEVTPIKDKGPMNESATQANMKDDKNKFSKRISRRKKISNILNSKPFENFIIFLIVVYCLLVIVNFALNDFKSDEDNNIDTATQVLVYIELFILLVFIIEIFLGIYVYSFKVILLLFSSISMTCGSFSISWLSSQVSFSLFSILCSRIKDSVQYQGFSEGY